MQVFDLKEVDKEDAGVLALGFFDCLHLGHKKVIDTAISIARKNGKPASVFLFKNNIFDLISESKTPLFDFETRLNVIESFGVDKVFYIDANKDFLSLSGNEFIEYLKAKLSIFGVVCGKDFTFGAKGKNDAEDLLAGFTDCQNAVVDILEINGEKISSTIIKNLLKIGRISEVNNLLGRRFSILGVVVSGRGDGKKIGYPTANIDSQPPIKNGVYFTNTNIDGKSFKSITNVGTHPTFDDKKKNVETFILNTSDDFVGKRIEIEFLKYRRDIVKFDTIQELVYTLDEDANARNIYD